VNTQLIKNQVKATQWMQRIKEYRSSGQPVSTWCSNNGILEQSYYYWLKKIRIFAMENMPESEPVFAKLPAMTNFAATSDAPIELKMQDITVTFRNDASRELISEVIAALRQTC